MIRNDRQYRITKAQAEEFERALRKLEQAPAAPDVHPLIADAQRAATQSQLDDLRAELAAYELLQKGHAKVLELTALEELPAALIRARIVAGLTQRQLAERLGMKEQQLQRYEATDYAGASLERIREVMDALGVSMTEDLYLPSADVSVAGVLRRVREAGLESAFVEKRLLANGVHAPDAKADRRRALKAAGVLNRVFGWAPSLLFGDAPLTAPRAAVAGVRYKLPASASARTTEAYSAYAYYLAGLVLRATPTLEQRPIPTQAATVRSGIVGEGTMDLACALRFVWSLGVPVLPLQDPGAFHAATWRVGGRNVIVLKQSTRAEARWMHDLLHEVWHAAQDPDDSERAVIDYEDLLKGGGSSEEETQATRFAGDVALDGRAEDLVEACVKACGGKVERLKTVLPRIAKREHVRVDSLANYMAFRLSLQGISWWGAATNLQETDGDPWGTARDVALDHMDLSRLDETERALVVHALEGES